MIYVFDSEVKSPCALKMADGERWLVDFEAVRFRLTTPGRARKAKLSAAQRNHAVTARPVTSPLPRKPARDSNEGSGMEMLFKAKNRNSKNQRYYGCEGFSFTKSSRFDGAQVKAPSTTSYIQHLKQTMDSISKSLPDLRSNRDGNNLGPGAYISDRSFSHTAVDSHSPKYTFLRAGRKRHIKQGRACFDIPRSQVEYRNGYMLYKTHAKACDMCIYRSQLDPVTLKCPRGMEILSANWTDSKHGMKGVLAQKGPTISAKTAKFPTPNKDFMKSCPGVIAR